MVVRFVKDLRFEINSLRRRAEDALEQKLQCEKGLGGLKMDLDRAEQETSSLRRLLLENDILVPEMSTADLITSGHATSATLERAYKELRDAQRVSVEKLRSMKGISTSEDLKTQETLDLLLKNMSDAEAERDFAQKQAAVLRAQTESLQDANEFHDAENASLANQLQASASRTEQLNQQVRRQLGANTELRERLAEAVGKGEREQSQSAQKISMLQTKLRKLEDNVMAAQQESEDSMISHEEDIRVIRKSNNPQLQRLKPSSRGSSVRNSSFTNLSAPKSPLYPRSPRLDKTTSGPGISMNEALRTEFLESRVNELEAALAEADSEMKEVVQRMNTAQIEVLELQSAR
jgi:chromosome segregation ATPase